MSNARCAAAWKPEAALARAIDRLLAESRPVLIEATYTREDAPSEPLRMTLHSLGERTDFPAITTPATMRAIRRANEAELQRLKELVETCRSVHHGGRNAEGTTERKREPHPESGASLTIVPMALTANIGPWNCEQKLGSGGNGNATVWLASHRDSAVKSPQLVALSTGASSLLPPRGVFGRLADTQRWGATLLEERRPNQRIGRQP